MLTTMSDAPVIHADFKGMMPPSRDYNSRVSRAEGSRVTVSRLPYNRSAPAMEAQRPISSPGRTNDLTRVDCTGGSEYRSAMWRHPYTHAPGSNPGYGAALDTSGVRVQGAFSVPVWDGIVPPGHPARSEAPLLSPRSAGAEPGGLEATAEAMMRIHHERHCALPIPSTYDPDLYPSNGTPRTVAYSAPRFCVTSRHGNYIRDGPAGKAWGDPVAKHTSGGGGWRVAMRGGLATTRACDLASPGKATVDQATAYRQGCKPDPEYHLKVSALSEVPSHCCGNSVSLQESVPDYGIHSPWGFQLN